MQSYLHVLPTDILFEVFGYLTASDMLQLMYTCKDMYQLTKATLVSCYKSTLLKFPLYKSLISKQIPFLLKGADVVEHFHGNVTDFAMGTVFVTIPATDLDEEPVKYVMDVLAELEIDRYYWKPRIRRWFSKDANNINRKCHGLVITSRTPEMPELVLTPSIDDVLPTILRTFGTDDCTFNGNTLFLADHKQFLQREDKIFMVDDVHIDCYTYTVWERRRNGYKIENCSLNTNISDEVVRVWGMGRQHLGYRITALPFKRLL